MGSVSSVRVLAKREAGGSEKGDVRIKQKAEGQALKTRL